MSWTDERVALLKKLWCEGRTAAEIAKELGGVTRNAVIGKAHRLKLSNRISPIQQNNVKPPARSKTEDKPVQQPRRKAANTDTAPIPVMGVKMIELREKMCRWPIGDPKEADFRFCGCQAVAGLPYCGEHAKIAYQAASRARALQAEDFEEKQAAASGEEEEMKGAVAS